MAHMYGMAFEFLFEFITGCHVFYLTRIPSPKIVFKAFAEVQPDIIIAVPLIIEKIIRKAVLPRLQSPGVKMLLKLPVISQKLRERIRSRIVEAFGGRFYEVIVGGIQLRDRTLPGSGRIPVHRRLRYDRMRTNHQLH